MTGRIYLFNPLPIPPPYKQHWERKIEEENFCSKEIAIKNAAKEASIEFSKCSHSESMFDEGSGICMSCGVFLGLCFAPLSANTSSIPGAHHHAFSSAATSSASRKKKIVAAAAVAAAGMIAFDSSTTTSSAAAVAVAVAVGLDNTANIPTFQQQQQPTSSASSTPSASSTKSRADVTSSSTSTSVSAVFPLFYEGKKVVIFNGDIPVYEPPHFTFYKNKNVSSSVVVEPVSEQKRKAFISYMLKISEEAFGKIFKDDSYHPLDNIIATGIYSFTGYGFCRHSISYVSSSTTTQTLNKMIIEAVPIVVEKDFEFFSSKRRRTQISLFVAIVLAHVYIVHQNDLNSIQDCLDIQRLRAKVKASLISKETQSSFYHAIGSRLGIDSKCSGRLVQDAYDMCFSKISSEEDANKDDRPHPHTTKN